MAEQLESKKNQNENGNQTASQKTDQSESIKSKEPASPPRFDNLSSAPKQTIASDGSDSSLEEAATGGAEGS